MTLEDIREILSDLEYKDWEFHVTEKGDGFLLQLRWWGLCTLTNCSTRQASRKWYVSKWMCLTEVVNTAFMAVRYAEEHEVREHFKFRKQRIYNPHSDVIWAAENVPPEDVRK